MANALISGTQFAAGVGGGLVVSIASAVLYSRAVKSRKRREFERVLSGRAEEPTFGSFTHWASGNPLKAEDVAGFSFRGQKFVAFRHTVSTRRMQGDDPVLDTQSYRVVQLATPVGPRLSIVPKENERAWAPVDARAGDRAITTGVAEFDQQYVIFTEDEAYAKAALPRESLRWLAGRKLGVPIVLADGVLSVESPGELDANVLRYADILVELARRMPPLRVVGQPAPRDSAEIRPGALERALLGLLVVGFLPLLATLVIIGAVAFVNSVAYFFGASGRVLAGGAPPLLPFLDSQWYGPYPDFGTAAQSFLLGAVLFGLPLVATGIGLVRRAKARTR
ncbi:hypothetical protein [Amycolatopsis albispora]|uniref:Uncharacterized protein n=1 Tax=Amycolatopsis albispora TaxID=1804986 RepID=A0A344LFG8_9PSEU|nr:hypothetical protein [Amycolatopsis albispora]AXB46792.1 hypothetical protein A4R43_33720 [Amycolatopsis albispora]